MLYKKDGKIYVRMDFGGKSVLAFFSEKDRRTRIVLKQVCKVTGIDFDLITNKGENPNYEITTEVMPEYTAYCITLRGLRKFFNDTKSWFGSQTFLSEFLRRTYDIFCNEINNYEVIELDSYKKENMISILPEKIHVTSRKFWQFSMRSTGQKLF